MIRFYIDGTTGQKDGTEVTSINPITATGLFPSGSTAASKSVKVYIRADAGEIDISTPFNLGNINTFTDVVSYVTTTVNVASFYPVIGFPLYLRTEAGFEISSGTLTAGYQSSTIIISAIGTQQSQVRPVLFQDKTALLQALDGSNIYAAISPNNPLAINSTNKITSVNSCLFFIVAIKPGAQVGDLYPQNLLNFSFTETELTS